jgi:hypothetical protein
MKFLWLTLATSLFAVQVDLRNPVYKQGVLYTNQGGVIQSGDIRIQAQTIQYFHNEQKIEAEGDLLIQYKGKAFVGSELEFDFLNQTGMVYDGKTFSSMWYIGGDTIELQPDGNYKVSTAYITTCENKESTWDLRAHRVRVVKDHLFEANNLGFRFFDFTAGWLPYLKLNLKKFKEPIFKYYVNWNKGPKVGFRYQLYSWRDLALYGRLEYRWKKGWGGALESEYFPQDKLTTFVTRNYAGTDRLFNAVDAEFRYRIQGALRSQTASGKTRTTLTWDKYSDVRMPGDFKSEDFEVNTAQKTLAYIHHTANDFLTYLKVRPRVNPFESIKQDLPTLYAIARPVEIPKTGILSTHFLKASYLNFQYSDQLVTSLQGFHSPRIEAYEMLQRPFQLGPLTLTPRAGGRAIFYGSSEWLALLDYGIKANFYGQRQYTHYKHLLEPYLEYRALSRPTLSPNSHFIYSIQDGYEKLQQIVLGARNILYSEKEASFTADLFANAFLSDPVIPQLFPRLYLYLAWRLPSLHATLQNCYNFQNQVVDFSNARLKWTVNENVALSLEARYRSKYNWRKCDQDNYILDVTRPESQLLNSPLSDRRISLLSNLFFRINPFWELKFESHHGLYRLYKNSIREKPFSEFQIHLYSSISSAWKLHLAYGYTVKNHFDWTVNVQLVKNRF